MFLQCQTTVHNRCGNNHIITNIFEQRSIFSYLVYPFLFLFLQVMFWFLTWWRSEEFLAGLQVVKLNHYKP